MRSVMADGTLLHPGSPATKIDSAILAAAIGEEAAKVRNLPRGEVRTT